MSIEITTLPNGLRVATDRIPTVESASIGVWVDAGTRHEAPSVNGVAHVLEHMAFKGTRRRSAQQIAEEIEAVGGHLNAYTSRETTGYFARILKEDAHLALDILADILQHSTLDEEELAKERSVILQEIGQANDTPDDIIFDHFQETAYPDQPLGRTILGPAEIIRDISREAIGGYLASHYGARRMVLVGAGNLEHARIVDGAAELFAGLPALTDAAPEPARYAGGDKREARDLEQLHFVLGFRGISYHDPDFYALSVLSTLLGGGMSSRLFQEIREKRGLVYSIYTFAASFLDDGLFGVYAGTGETEAAELVPVLCAELTNAAGSITAEEVDRARAQLKASLLMSRESTMARSEQLAHQLLVFGRPVPAAEIVEKLTAVDTAALSRVARRIFASAPTVAALGPLGGLEDYPGIARRLA